MNAEIIWSTPSVMDGAPSLALLTATGAILGSELATTISKGLDMGRDSVESGSAYRKLDH